MVRQRRSPRPSPPSTLSANEMRSVSPTKLASVAVLGVEEGHPRSSGTSLLHVRKPTSKPFSGMCVRKTNTCHHLSRKRGNRRVLRNLGNK